MKRRGIALLIGLAVVTFALAGCAGNADNGATPSPSPSASDTTASPSTEASPSAETSSSPSPEASPSPSPSPSVSVAPDGFVMGKVTTIDGNQITLSVVNPAGTKTITADTNTSFAVSGSTKSAALSDIAVGDVITATLNGTTALKIINDGPNIDPNPSAYISPSPSPSADASPSAS
ncbi:hypothetical protein SAMN02745823_01198 [Sporobacter termitidis DSM 10068]|uniref:DUF5666 domain-containing protein n=1 Tax=Sporobacter termitidis DSM 10068 TaxID=1123282 RepID=A0A1M5WCH6_9FIRM|nr:hypothetical protein [Sporobacter termitidis]SHH85289.1 hypothetical protein SAMN02745823_01198 [Sporobacter termitidis DSM 10068]